MWLTDDNDKEINPRAFLSPCAGPLYTQNAISALAEIDPDNAQTYGRNGEEYIPRIEVIDEGYTETLESVPPSNETWSRPNVPSNTWLPITGWSKGTCARSTPMSRAPGADRPLAAFVNDQQPHAWTAGGDQRRPAGDGNGLSGA